MKGPERVSYLEVYSNSGDEDMEQIPEEPAPSTLEQGYYDQIKTLQESRKNYEDFEIEAADRLKKAKNSLDDIRDECLI